MTGKPRAPSAAIARRRMTPVVVSSVPARTSGTWSRPLLVEQRDEVAAVVHRELRVRVGDRFEVARNRCRGPRRAGRRTGMPYSATSAAATSSWVESGFEAARDDLGAARLEGAHQVGGLGGDVEAGADRGRPRAAARARTARGSSRRTGISRSAHVDPSDALGGEAEVGDVVGRRRATVDGHRGRPPCGRRGGGAGREAGHGEPRRWTSRSSKRTCSA